MELEPRSTQDALALANCALQFGDTNTAEKSLIGLNKSGKHDAAFHAAAARLAKARKNPQEARNEWGEALRLAPNDESYQMQFALSCLDQPTAAQRQEGLRILEKLRSSPVHRSTATRSLFLDGVTHHHDPQELRALAKDLQSYPEAFFADRLLYLDILRQLHNPEYTTYLTNIEKDASSNPSDLAALLSWMNANEISIIGIDFAKSLPEKMLNTWPVPWAMAEAYAKISNWSVLERHITNSNWGQFEFMRHAYLGLALRGQDKPVASSREWVAAQKEAGGQPQLLSMLTRAVADWRWEKEWVDLLWTLTNQPETQIEALHGLYQKYADAGETIGLYRVLLKLTEIQPDDTRAQNNLAQISLLLNADVERARRLATELYRKEGSNPAYASTYAFALFSKGDTNGALRVMSALREEQLRDPSLAAYYGIILAAAGDSAKAREYLKIGASAKLLPEEKALLAKAESTAQ